ncbi:hypothetical protein ACFQZ4_54240 [Catellatospora coxensis]
MSPGKVKVNPSTSGSGSRTPPTIDPGKAFMISGRGQGRSVVECSTLTTAGDHDHGVRADGRRGG